MSTLSSVDVAAHLKAVEASKYEPISLRVPTAKNAWSMPVGAHMMSGQLAYSFFDLLSHSLRFHEGFSCFATRSLLHTLHYSLRVLHIASACSN